MRTRDGYSPWETSRAWCRRFSIHPSDGSFSKGARPAAPPVSDDFGPVVLEHLEGDFLDEAGKR